MKKMKGKILTKSIITVIIAVLLIILGVQNVAQAQTITISNISEMSYSVNSKRLYHFTESTGTYTNLYCLNGGAHRSAYDVLTAGGSMYNLDDETISQIFGSRERYNSAIWLIDNMYVANNVDAATKAMMLENIANLIKSKEQVVEQTYSVELDSAWIDGMMADYAGRENLIYAVQQCTLWYFTNNLTQNIGVMTPGSITGSVIIPGDGKDDSTAYTKTKYHCYIYTAMQSLAQDNSGYVSPNASSMQTYLNNISLDSNSAKVDRANGKIGPFILNNDDKQVPELTKYTVTVNNAVLGKENYDLVKDGNNIYVQFKNGYKLDDATEYTINLKLDIKMIATDAQYFYTPGNLTTKQPLFDLRKWIIGKPLEGRVRTEAVSEFDLHLIKNITDVYIPVNDNGTTKYILNKTDKQGANEAVPALTNRLYSRVGSLQHGATTDTYLTNKAFVTVPTGSIIRYKISIHNEGDLNGYAEEITDNLANGLEFVSLKDLKAYGIEETTDYGWVKTDAKSEKVSAAYKTNYLSSSKSADNIIKAYDATTNTIDTKEVYIYCKVTSKDNKDTLKNVAEITADKTYDVKNEYKDVDDRDSTPKSITIEQLTSDIENWKGTAQYTANQMNENGKYSVPGLQDDDDYENVRVQTLDLALTKQIVNVEYKLENDSDSTAVSNRLRTYKVSGLLDGTTATYIMNKPAYGVVTGAIVRYRITVYNESDINGFATEITDYLPEGLEYRVDSELNQLNGWTATKNSDGTTTVKTNKLKNRELLAYTGGNTLDSDFVEIECNVVSENIGKVLTNISEITEYGYYIGTDYIQAIADENGNPIVDRDSYQDSVQTQLKTTNVSTSITEYEKLVNAQTMRNWMNKTEYDVEDDDDFEQLIIEDREYDLSLRKYISAVNGKNIVNRVDLTSYAENTTRIPKINSFSEAMRNAFGTAEYYHGKEAIEVYVGDEVTYTLRVYNEGGIADYNGIATEITDYLPAGVEFVKLADGYEGYTATYNKELNSIKITYAGNQILQSNTIKKIAQATDSQKYDEISKQWYQEVAVICKVSTDAESKILTNRAEITAQKAFDETGVEVDVADRDSTPNSLISSVEGISEKSAILNLSNYYNVYKYGINDDHMTYYPGVEGDGSKQSQDQDDIDFENIKVKKFDLALRKFITGVTSNGTTTDITNRYPVFKIDENGNYVYEHTKEPVTVDTNNIVTYTLRIYNEGEAHGYAQEVLDDIPDGLEFVAYISEDGSINDKYRWIMYKNVTDEEIATLPEGTVIKDFNGAVTENGTVLKKCVVTTDPSEADYIVTDYLSYENGKTITTENKVDAETGLQYNINLLKPFNSSTMAEPDYRDIKVQFKVVEPQTSDRIITNFAQITDDSDKYNEEVTDVDSTPNVWIDGEDDQDTEKIKVRYFDLALVKWVSEATVIEDGVEKVAPGNNLEDLQNQYDHRLIYALYPETISNYTDLEPVVKVDIPKNKLGSIVVKFKYQIRVYNEGEIDGYAKEITDYIPKNMKFVQEDNPLWKDAGDGKVVTNQLANTLLKAKGQPETIEITYTWINGENNLGLLVNTAEISQDYNEYGTPDIDSTPGNFVVNEDDIDDAAVILSIRTGNEIPVTYTIVGVAVVSIISAGVILIKKYVL